MIHTSYYLREKWYTHPLDRSRNVLSLLIIATKQHCTVSVCGGGGGVCRGPWMIYPGIFQNVFNQISFSSCRTHPTLLAGLLLFDLIS